jgi:hypothetical protein
MRNPAGYTKMFHGWFDADISDGARLTILAIYSFFNQQHRSWFETPTVVKVAKLRGMSEDRIKDHYRELEDAGLIKRTREAVPGKGSIVTVTIIEPSDKSPCFYEGGENTTLRGGQEHHPLKVAKTPPSYIGINTKGFNKSTTSRISADKSAITSSNSENFLDPIPSSEPTPQPQRLVRIESPKLIAPKFPPGLRDKVLSILGPDADGILASVNQLQIDSGFVEYALKRVKGNETPGRLYNHLRKTEWKIGWENPEKAKEEARAARKAKRNAMWSDFQKEWDKAEAALAAQAAQGKGANRG